MKRFLCILSTFITLLSTANAQQSRLLGSWNGKLEAGGSSLTLVLHFTVDSLGKTHFFLDSPDQGAEGIPGEIALLDRGHTIIAVEHNPYIIAAADHIIELGPEGGDQGGYLLKQ